MRRACMALLLYALVLVGACRAQTPGQHPSDETPVPAETPIMHTPAPTPEPELTALDAAFRLAREKVRQLPPQDDPNAVFPLSSAELLGGPALREATPRQLEWGWREIAARQGIRPYRAYDFTDREWYEPDPDFARDKFTQTEAMNLINLRNTALENFANIKLVRNNRAQADLDGDGKSESFSLTADRFSSTAVLQIQNYRYTIELPQIDNKIYLCDIDKSTPGLELAVPFVRPGDDYRLAFFAWSPQGLVMLGEVQGDRDTIRIYGDGTIAAHALESIICPWRYRLIYRLEGDHLRPQGIGTRQMLIPATLRTTLPLVNEDGAHFTLTQGSEVVLMAITPPGECILYDVAKDRVGMFLVEDGLINGLSATEVFDGLPAVG